MGKKSKKSAEQIEEVRKRWFDKIYSSIDTSMNLMEEERNKIYPRENEVKDIIDDIIVIGIYSLSNLKTKLKEKEVIDQSFRFYIYDIYDPAMLESIYIALATDILGRETARKIFSAIMACEISMRNRKNRAISKCCCETENLFH